MTVSKIQYYVRVSATLWENVYNGAYVYGSKMTDVFYENCVDAENAINDLMMEHADGQLTGIILRDMSGGEITVVPFMESGPVVLSMSIGTKIKHNEATITKIVQ